MIDEKRIQENIELLSFPRLFGSEDEKRAADIAKEKIEDVNYITEVQPFSFTRFYSIFYSRGMFVILFVIAV